MLVGRTARECISVTGIINITIGITQSHSARLNTMKQFACDDGGGGGGGEYNVVCCSSSSFWGPLETTEGDQYTFRTAVVRTTGL